MLLKVKSISIVYCCANDATCISGGKLVIGSVVGGELVTVSSHNEQFCRPCVAHVFEFCCRRIVDISVARSRLFCNSDIDRSTVASSSVVGFSADSVHCNDSFT